MSMMPVWTLASDRAPGVSFICRARNEAEGIGASLRSLRGITVPYEIVVVCHLCTDGTQAVVEAEAAAHPPPGTLRVLQYSKPVSRAGFETLATPLDHSASLPRYMAWCFSQARFRWIMRWDADFVASPEFVAFINTGLDIGSLAPTRYAVPVVLGADTATPRVSTEDYLHNCILGVRKFLFWETGVFVGDSVKVPPPMPATVTTVSVQTVKAYWREPPWFEETKNSSGAPHSADAVPIKAAYDAITAILGPEPTGMARCLNHECDPYNAAALKHEELLKAAGVQVRL